MIDFLQRFGVPLIFAVVFLNQLGLPIPGAPFVLAIGAMAGRGLIDPIPSLLVATAASLGADSLWFYLGRRNGTRLLRFICRVSLEPDTCVSMTQGIFARYGEKSLLVAKFVPGFGTVAPPLAGLLGIGTVRFLLWSTGAALLWLLALGGLGYVLNNRLEVLAARAESMGSALGLIVAAIFALYVGWRYLGRMRVLRALRVDRITPEELHRMVVGGEGPVIVDVRNELAIGGIPLTIPGALFMTFEELDRRHHEIPRARDVILYCS